MKPITFLATLIVPIAITVGNAAIVQANSSKSTVSDDKGFILPDKATHCRLAEFADKPNQNFLRCQAGPLNPMPPQPKSCTLDWGNGLVLPKNKSAEVLCAGDIIYSPSLPVLNYGKTWTASGFSCNATGAGLTCTNGNRKGFFLSKKTWRRI